MDSLVQIVNPLYLVPMTDVMEELTRSPGRGPEAAALVGGRARMIADSLLTGIAMRRDGLAGGRAGKDLPHV